MKRAYVSLMMRIVGRGLAIASRVDREIAEELHHLPVEMTIAMRVYPNGPCCLLQRTHDDLIFLGVRDSGDADMEIIFKHLQHAWLLYTFRENTPTAFARNRIVLDGEISHAVVFNRCLNRLLSLILPRLIARRAVKRYPMIALRDKLLLGAAIYLRLPLERTRSAI
ncbi:MAG: hypothetical protein QNJ07_02500 [Woeseiaceae bacterium]|nr:hypothetical protein [Woeseiaceae bacterium]